MNRVLIFVTLTLVWVPLDFIFSPEVKASLVGSMAAGTALWLHWLFGIIDRARGE